MKENEQHYLTQMVTKWVMNHSVTFIYFVVMCSLNNAGILLTFHLIHKCFFLMSTDTIANGSWTIIVVLLYQSTSSSSNVFLSAGGSMLFIRFLFSFNFLVSPLLLHPFLCLPQSSHWQGSPQYLAFLHTEHFIRDPGLLQDQQLWMLEDFDEFEEESVGECFSLLSISSTADRVLVIIFPSIRKLKNPYLLFPKLSSCLYSYSSSNSFFTFL